MNSSTIGRVVRRRPYGHRLELCQVDLDIEVTSVRHDRTVAHLGEVLGPQHLGVARDGHEYFALLSGHLHRLDPETVQDRFQGAQRVDLGDGDERAQSPRPDCHALAARAVTGDDETLAGDQDVRGADDAVERGLARPVAVVEQTLGLCVVHRDDRVAQYSGRLHRPEADHTGRGVLGTSDHLFELVRAELVEA